MSHARVSARSISLLESNCKHLHTLRKQSGVKILSTGAPGSETTYERDKSLAGTTRPTKLTSVLRHQFSEPPSLAGQRIEARRSASTRTQVGEHTCVPIHIAPLSWPPRHHRASCSAEWLKFIYQRGKCIVSLDGTHPRPRSSKCGQQALPAAQKVHRMLERIDTHR